MAGTTPLAPGVRTAPAAHAPSLGTGGRRAFPARLGALAPGGGVEEKKKGGKREKKEMTPLRFVLSRGRGEESCARRSAPRGAGSAQSSCQPRAALARGVRPAARADALPRPRGPPADTGTAAAPFRGRRGLRGAARRASAAAGRDVPGQAIAAERPPPAPRHSSLEQTKLSELRKKKPKQRAGGQIPSTPTPQYFAAPREGPWGPVPPSRGSGGWRRRRARSSATPSPPVSLTEQ